MKKRIKKIFIQTKIYLRHPWKFKSWFLLRRLEKQKKNLSIEEYLQKKFKIDLGYKLNLKNPRTFNEKMQWLKINDHNKIYTDYADKHKAKEIIGKKIGFEHIAKEYSFVYSFSDVNFDALPNEFVIKTNHSVGPITICKEKSALNDANIITKYESALKENYYENYYEWPYKNIKPGIIFEELLKDNVHKVLPVFKFFCFNGKPVIAQIILNDKQVNETIDYIDMDFNYLKLNQGYPNSKKKNKLGKPLNFDDMKKYASILSRGFPFLRCDFYDCGGKIYFSECTFYSDSGFARFFPKKWDLILGNMIVLPKRGTDYESN